MIIITHKLNEVLAISDRVTILRKGKSVATVATAETNAQELTELMVGKKISLQIERPCVKQEKALFEVHHLSVRNEDGVYALNDISFDLNGGEILGVAGVAGSGQKELCETVAGLMHAEKGAILYKKENIVGKSPREIIKMGISMSFIPEDRLGMGLVASMGMTDNMLLKSYKNGKSPFINKKPARELALRLIDTLEIVTPGVTTPVSRLSGGNVQKVLLGREIESEPQLLITAYPVRGLDINSSYTIYDLLNEQKKKRRGSALHRRRSRCAAGAVRPDHGAVPWSGHRHSRGTERHQRANRPPHGRRNDQKGGRRPMSKPTPSSLATRRSSPEPLLRVVKKPELPPWQASLLRVVHFSLPSPQGRYSS